MSKRNSVTYIKPADPKFLRIIKEQIGYDEGPNIDTKRQKIDEGLSGGSDSEEEAPQVVVLKTGDLTAEEAEIEQKRIEKEENERPADLNLRVIFKSKRAQGTEKSGEKSDEKPGEKSDEGQTSKSKEKSKSKKRPEPAKSKLSFQDDEDEDDE